jgi:hypothetical protein
MSALDHAQTAAPQPVPDDRDHAPASVTEAPPKDARLGRHPPREVLVTDEVRAMLGEPHLLPGECRGAYDRLLEEIAHARKPKDAVEWLLIKDIVDAQFEAERLKGLKHEAVASRLARMLRERITEIYTQRKPKAANAKAYAAHVSARATDAVAAFMRGDVKRHEALLRQVNLATLKLDVYDLIQDLLEPLDRMLGITVTRRLKAAQAIETRRLAIAREWRLYIIR